MIFTLLHRSSGIGASLYLKCEEIWKSEGILSGPDERDRLLVAYVASRLSHHVQLFGEHMECFNFGIKGIQNDQKLPRLEIPDTFDGVRKLPVERRIEILNQITTASKNPGIMTHMERAWHYLVSYTLQVPATGIMTDENLLTYIFDSTSAHHKRIVDCLALFFEFTASEIEACVKSLPDDEASLKPAICTLYNHLRAPKQGAILLNKQESIDDNLAHLVVNQLGRLGLHTDQTGVESRTASTDPSARKKPRTVHRDNLGRTGTRRARRQVIPSSYGTRSHKDNAVANHAQVS